MGQPGQCPVAARRRRDVEQAVADFTKAIDLAPDNPLGYYNRALAHSEAENWELSNSDLKAAQELDPRDTVINDALCRQLGVQRRPEEALPFCDRAWSERRTGRQGIAVGWSMA